MAGHSRLFKAVQGDSRQKKINYAAIKHIEVAHIQPRARRPAQVVPTGDLSDQIRPNPTIQNDSWENIAQLFQN
jgi:hypothetical protein